MDGRRGTIDLVWIGPTVLGLLMLATWFSRSRLPKTTSLTVCEYWIYLPEPKLPKIEAIMTRMITENPHFKRGNPPIGAREGMLFSDIRLHMAIARRSKNPHLFRPDLFHPAVEPTADTLACLNQSVALAKLRYLSEVPLADSRHLQFMPHLADAVADLGDGVAIFDPISDRLETRAGFSQRLSANPNQERIDHHFRVVWTITENGGVVETRGLRKVGIPELKTAEVPEDEKSVV